MPPLPGNLISRANAIPDHMLHHRRAVVFDNHNLHAVFQRECGHGVLKFILGFV